MPMIYVPRVFGGTLILNAAPPPPSTIPNAVVLITFRDGEVQAKFRDGEVKAMFRDGQVIAGDRG